MTERTSVYRGAKLAVAYDRVRCIHAAECGRGLKKVFDASKDPWIDPDLAQAEEVIAVIERCPSGALTYERLDGGAAEAPAPQNTVAVMADGPLYLHGTIALQDSDRNPVAEEARVALCRCGQSTHKPYCDGSHAKARFKDSGAVAADPVTVTLDAGPLAVRTRRNGPYVLDGPFTLIAASGRIAQRATQAALCRCGQSANRPFCDGTHKDAGFDAA